MVFKIVKNKWKFLSVSFLIIIIGIGSMIYNYVNGNEILNFDIEFTGGTAIVLDMAPEHFLEGEKYDFDNDDIAKIVTEVTGQASPQIQKIVGKNQASIKIQSIDSEKRTELIDALIKNFQLSEDSVLSLSDISATVSGEMQKTAIMAVLVACVAMLIYISIRFFDLNMGISAIIALVHDVCIMVSFYAIFRVPVNNAFIAALLTVLGYSINSTIVIFDRIRENKKGIKKPDYESLVDTSLWQTMRRSIYTSLTTLFTLGALYVFGVPSLKEFSLPIIVGVISGMYSSVFIAGSIWYSFIRVKGEPVKYEFEKENEENFVDPFENTDFFEETEEIVFDVETYDIILQRMEEEVEEFDDKK
ncbi:MAG: protein translocase subunit SecF [Anaerotignaceae bacterium]